MRAPLSLFAQGLAREGARGTAARREPGGRVRRQPGSTPCIGPPVIRLLSFPSRAKGWRGWRRELAVEPQQVVLGKTEATDGCVGFHGIMAQAFAP